MSASRKISPCERIGLEVRRRRVAAGMSRPIFSEKAGIPLNTLTNIESGRYDIRVSTFFKVCSHLGIDMGFLNELKER